ncbi:S8 family serine peptidase [Parasediminibacterium sp. JCM 36343]|uniref:S8 family serine peptidase n=1 Tax=Parasediminibacterium sp. JCM 36343 TaxID=3374279 RepID=UPI00397AB493
MNKIRTLSFIIAFIFNCNGIYAQTVTNEKALESTATVLKTDAANNLQKAYAFAKAKNWDMGKQTRNRLYSLMGVNQFNHPIYYTTFNNIIAAATVGTDQLWPGGSSGLSLNGSSANMKNKLAIWDGARVLETHVELAGRVMRMDSSSYSGANTDHATHVTGTMIATGINPLAKGMSFGLQSLQAYDFYNDNSEMSAAAPSLLLSNHSYGIICGWYQDGSGNWIFEGNNGDTADYNFGYYDDVASSWDNIAYNAPYYLIVKAAGNNRNVNGPAVGQPYEYYDNSGNLKTANRPVGISNNDGYDIIGTSGNAKNIITVGAVAGIPGGYTRKEDVVMTPFSSWGPTDDGRIKPDLVADGVNVLSCSGSGNTDYITESGTSMSTPNVTGSLLLLQDYYAQLKNGAFMRSATLKGLAIHTASEAGDFPGPDYKFGWGLLNMQQAAAVITAGVGSNNGFSSKHLLFENVLVNKQSYTLNVIANGSSPLTATICWTDPKGNVENVNLLNNRTPKLVNDLDIRITKDNATFFPWKLTPAVPAAAATTGDNTLDNVEKIEIDSVVPGQAYTIQVSHKGTLTNGSQAYSLLVSGVGGNAYCTSAPSSSAGTTIDSVAFAGINNKNKTGCTTYSNFTNLTASIKPSQTLPITVKLGSCDATQQDKTVKVFIDYNANGSFSDSGELVAIGHVTAANSKFTASIVTPSNLVVGTYALMRIVAVETTNADSVSPCGQYGKGETQDYKILVIQPDNDIAVTGILTPTTGDYSNSSQLIAVKITNKGSFTQQAIALTAVVKNGNSSTTFTGIYPSPILSGASATYTFQAPFVSLPATNYTITVTATIPLDENTTNNTFSANIATAAPVAATANDCNNTINLKIANPSSSTYYAWYNNFSAVAPIATGSKATTTVMPPDGLFYLGAGNRGNVGLANKGSSSGDYQASGNNYLKYTATAASVLESARLYTRYPGTLNIMVADISNATATGYDFKVLSSKTIDVYATNPSPAVGSTSGNDPADTGAVFYINLPLPAGSHSIIVSATDATIFRNNGLAKNATYPYSIPNFFSITGNGAISATDATDTTFYKAFYYYLYNMKVRAQDYVGDKIPVPLYVSPTPIISDVNDTLVSSVATGNQWYADGVLVAGATGKTYTPTNTAPAYSVTVTDSFGCQTKSLPFYIGKIVPIIAPNPAKGAFKVSFYANLPTNFSLSLTSTDGKLLYTKTVTGFKGNFSEMINISSLASGMYILEVFHNGTMDRKKIIIQQ